MHMAVTISDCAKTAQPLGIQLATEELPPCGHSSQNLVQQLRLKAHRVLRSELPGLCVPALIPRVRRSHSADDVTAQRTCVNSSSLLLAEQHIVSLQ